MSLARFDYGLMNRLHRDLEQVLSESRSAALIPRVEVQELAERYVLRADLPGVAPQDIEVTTDQGILVLSAKRSGGQNGTTDYQRQFTLPEDARADDITARSHHGVLEISIGKTPKVQPRRITVQAA
jgi:HSP20 family protein